MNDAKWTEIVGRIADEFTIIEKNTEDLPDSPGRLERIVFRGPAGILKIERTVRPRVAAYKTTGSKRIGSDMMVEKVYAEDDWIDSIAVFQERGSQWLPLQGGETMFSR